MSLQTLLDKTSEEFDKEFLRFPYKKNPRRLNGYAEINEATNIKQFIRTAQLEAVKAFAEEVMDKIYCLKIAKPNSRGEEMMCDIKEKWLTELQSVLIPEIRKLTHLT